MAAITSTLPTGVHNRRKRVRHRIQTPAYVTFASDPRSAMLDLHEIVDISEDGIAIQCHSPLEVQKRLNLSLDLADYKGQIHTTGEVVWSNSAGRAGLRFDQLTSDSLARLREWLFTNVMAGVANGEAEIAAYTGARASGPPLPSYTDILAAITAVRRQVEALGFDLSGALQLVTERAQVLVRASGVAIALAGDDRDFMICRASAGSDAPPVGARLQIGSGFSGECVKSGMLLRCDDAEVDARVDASACRALGIRSILAAPVRAGEKSVGIIEAFSAQPNAFSQVDGRVFQRLAEIVLAAANRASRVASLPPLVESPAPSFIPPAGGMLFSAKPEPENKHDRKQSEPAQQVSISLPRSYLVILALAAATISGVLGYYSAPWIRADAMPWLQNKIHAGDRAEMQTVLASSHPVKPEGASNPQIETATLDQLREMADKGDAAAQNILGIRYATGDGVNLSEAEAVRWFTKAAEHGNVAAQSKLGSIYYSGRGVPQDSNRAYFWMVVARLSGDSASNALSPFVRARLTRAQVTSIELDADRWLQQHREAPKPPAGQLKAKN